MNVNDSNLIQPDMSNAYQASKKEELSEISFLAKLALSNLQMQSNELSSAVLSNCVDQKLLGNAYKKFEQVDQLCTKLFENLENSLNNQKVIESICFSLKEMNEILHKYMPVKNEYSESGKLTKRLTILQNKMESMINVQKFLQEKLSQINELAIKGMQTIDSSELNKNILLELAIESNDKKVVIDLLEHASYKKEELEPILFKVVSEDSRIFTEILLKYGAPIDAQDNEGNTPLHFAVQNGSLETVKLLLKLKANPNISNQLGHIPLHLAAHFNQTQKIEALIKAGANQNAQTKEGDTPVHYAVEKNSLESLKILLLLKAKINLYNKLEQTPLHVAVHLDDPKIIKYLIENDADLNSLDEDGNTPVHYAIQKNALAGLKLLIASKAKLSIPNKMGSTPLHLAANSNQRDIVESLIKNGADVSAQDKNGYTPLGMACLKMNQLTIQLLCEAGASTGLKNQHQIKISSSEQIFPLAKICLEISRHNPLTSEVLSLKFLGHSWKNKGITNVQQTKFSIGEGARSYYFSHEMQGALQSFTKIHPKIFNNEEKILLTDLLTKGSSQSRDLEKLLAEIKNDQPVIIHTGFKNHSVTVLFYEHHLIITNKGGESKKPIEVYEIDKSLITKEKLLQIYQMQVKPAKEYLKWLDSINFTLGAKSTLLSQKVENSYPIETLGIHQLIGNCAWESLETCVFALLSFHRLSSKFEEDKKLNIHNQSSTAGIVTETKKVFLHWLQFTQLYAVREYLHLHNTKEMQEIPFNELLHTVFLENKNSWVDNLKDEAATLQKECLKMLEIQKQKNQIIGKVQALSSQLMANLAKRHLDVGLA